MPRKWSDEQIQYLKNNYKNPNITISDMSKEINVPKSTLTCKLHELNLKNDYDKTHKIGWTKDEEDFIINNCEYMSINKIATHIKKSPSTVSTKIAKMGLSTKYKIEHYWSDEDIEYLKNNYYKSSMKTLMKKLKRSESSIEGQLTKLNIKRKNKGNWSLNEINILKDNFNSLDYNEISKLIDRSIPAISNKAHELGLTKNSINRTKLKKQQIDFIINNYNTYTDSNLAKMFNVSTEAIAEVRKTYNIKKNGNEVKGISYIEKTIKDYFDLLDIKYIYNEYLGDYKPDFYIEYKNLIIEVQGDYFHCNPYIYANGPIDDIQQKHILKDYYKKCYYTSRGYTILYIWEYDINNNFEKVKEKISAVLGRNS